MSVVDCIVEGKCGTVPNALPGNRFLDVHVGGCLVSPGVSFLSLSLSLFFVFFFLCTKSEPLPVAMCSLLLDLTLL